MVEGGDLDDKLEDKATNEVVDDVKKAAMEGVDKEKKQVAMKVANTSCLVQLWLLIRSSFPDIFLQLTPKLSDSCPAGTWRTGLCTPVLSVL